MIDLNRTLLDPFRSSDGLLLPDESVIEEISKKQHELRVWNEDTVFQGLITMKELLQELVNQNSLSVWDLARHLLNWTIVFIPSLTALDLHDDVELVSCLESPDHHVSTLATIMLGYEEFNFVGGIEKFSEILNHRCQTTLRLETCRLLYT